MPDLILDAFKYPAVIFVALIYSFPSLPSQRPSACVGERVLTLSLIHI